jgi:hypothetical protein
MAIAHMSFWVPKGSLMRLEFRYQSMQHAAAARQGGNENKRTQAVVMRMLCR